MFVASDNELRQFVDSLLKQRKAQKAISLLEAQDEKYFRFTKLSMLQKMPKELHSIKFHNGLRSDKKIIPMKSSFPKMFQDSDKKVYQYINENVENMKKISRISEKLSTIRSEKQATNTQQKPFFPQQIIQDNILQQEIKQIPQQLSQKLNEVSIGNVKNQQQSYKSKQKTQKITQENQHFSNKSPSKMGIQPSRINPFVAKNLSFTDQFANSKTLQSKYPFIQFNQNSRNIAAIAQSAKFSAFSQSVAYPTAVMPGTILAPQQSMFSKEVKLDVADVMRYTLGVKKDQTQTRKMQNPFERRPKRND